MLCLPIGPDGTIKPADPQKDIEWLHDFMHNEENAPVAFERAIHIFRRTHFPFFYDPSLSGSGKNLTIMNILIHIK